jgi:MFS family permease
MTMRTSDRLPFGAAFGALLIIAATYVVNAMDRMVFPTLLPSVDKEYAFTLAAGGFLATIFTLGLGVAGVPGGFLFDRMSRKTMAIVGIVVYSICTMVTCLSAGFYDMAAYRAVSGIGEALQNAAIFTIAGAYFSRNRTLAFGLLNAAYGVGSFIGPRWGVHLLAGSGSWRLPLFVYGVVGLVGAVVTLLLVPKRFTEQYAEAAQTGVDAYRHIPDRIINRNTVLVGLTLVCGGIAGYGYLGLYPTFLRTQLHFSMEATGAAASMYGAGALMGIVCGYLADRVNQKWLMIVTLVSLSVIGYALFNLAVTPFWQSVLSFLQGSAFSGFLYVNSYSLMQRAVRPAVTGRASGLVVTCIYLPAALSGYLFAELVARFGWGNAALIQMSLLLVVPTIAMLFFDLAKTSCKDGAAPRVSAVKAAA